MTLVAAVTADEKITLGVPGMQCPRCIESITATLNKMDSSVKVTSTMLDTKQVEISYDPARVATHQIVAGVSEAPPVHNKRYEAGLIITVEEPVKSGSKLKKALGQVKGVVNYVSLSGGNADSGDVMIILRPILPNTKPADYVKASQIAESLEKNGVRFTGLPGGREPSEDLDTKKKPALAKASKSKLGGDELVADKQKSPRTPPIAPKPRSRDLASKAKDKEKEDESNDRPRFSILAGDSDKVYLVDHETKSDEGKELKKLVKEGDRFGDFVIKEVGDEDGLFVVLEHAESKDTIRVEHRKKEADKPK
jgi:copper chaperone CopZ